MPKVLKDLFQSKKFLSLLLGVVVLALKEFGLDEATANTIGGLIGVYILGQGVSDGLSGGMTSSQPGTPTAENLPKN